MVVVKFTVQDLKFILQIIVDVLEGQISLIYICSFAVRSGCDIIWLKLDWIAAYHWPRKKLVFSLPTDVDFMWEGTNLVLNLISGLFRINWILSYGCLRSHLDFTAFRLASKLNPLWVGCMNSIICTHDLYTAYGKFESSLVIATHWTGSTDE